MSTELELAGFTRASLKYDIDKLKRTMPELGPRMDYIKRINERW